MTSLFPVAGKKKDHPNKKGVYELMKIHKLFQLQAGVDIEAQTKRAQTPYVKPCFSWS